MENVSHSPATISAEDKTNQMQNQELSRKELLGAIDFEISQREHLTTNHGISVWAIIGAIVTLLGASANELSEPNHDPTNTLLVVFAGWLLLTHIVGLFTKMLGLARTVRLPSDKEITLKYFLISSGLETDSIVFYAIEVACAFALSVYLGAKGFYLLGIFGGIFYGLIFLLFLLVWLLLQIQIPVPHSEQQAYPRFNRVAMFIFWVLAICIAFVTLASVVHAWPGLAKGDIRLGSLLAALATVLSFSLKYRNPPIGLIELRSLRTRLALGMVPEYAARIEAEGIIMGPAYDNYLTKKADAVIDALNERKRLFEKVVERMERTKSLSENLRAIPADEKLIEEAANELRGLMGRTLSDLKSAKAHLLRACRLRLQMERRVKVAKFWLEIPRNEIQAVVHRVEEAAKMSNAAGDPIQTELKHFFEAGTFLSDSIKGHPAAKKQLMKLSEAFEVLFRE